MPHAYFNDCVDENECASGTSPCGGGNCINTLGSYRCGCPDGYQYDNGMSVCLQVQVCSSVRFARSKRAVPCCLVWYF